MNDCGVLVFTYKSRICEAIFAMTFFFHSDESVSFAYSNLLANETIVERACSEVRPLSECSNEATKICLHSLHNMCSSWSMQGASTCDRVLWMVNKYLLRLEYSISAHALWWNKYTPATIYKVKTIYILFDPRLCSISNILVCGISMARCIINWIDWNTAIVFRVLFARVFVCVKYEFLVIFFFIDGWRIRAGTTT